MTPAPAFIMPVRYPDWDDRLTAYLDWNAATPFAWGQHDCGLSVAGAVLAMTGVDFGAPFRGRYRTPQGAARAMRRNGPGGLPETLTAALGPPQPLAFGHRGDVCMMGDAVGILRADHGLFVGRAPDDPGVVNAHWMHNITGFGWVRVPRHLLDSETCWPVAFEGSAV